MAGEAFYGEWFMYYDGASPDPLAPAGDIVWRKVGPVRAVFKSSVVWHGIIINYSSYWYKDIPFIERRDRLIFNESKVGIFLLGYARNRAPANITTYAEGKVQTVAYAEGGATGRGLKTYNEPWYIWWATKRSEASLVFRRFRYIFRGDVFFRHHSGSLKGGVWVGYWVDGLNAMAGDVFEQDIIVKLYSGKPKEVYNQAISDKDSFKYPPAIIVKIGPLHTLTIKVQDEQGNPVKDADISLKGPISITDKTGKEGMVVFEDMLQGAYLVEVKAEGFLKYNTTLTLKADKELTVVLKKPPIPLTRYIHIAILIAIAATATVNLLMKRRRRRPPEGSKEIKVIGLFKLHIENTRAKEISLNISLTKPLKKGERPTTSSKLHLKALSFHNLNPSRHF